MKDAGLLRSSEPLRRPLKKSAGEEGLTRRCRQRIAGADKKAELGMRAAR
jgi:hypothetical protein